jgi:DNA-directed RNA polymerase subunit L
MEIKKCKSCNAILKNRWQLKYCSNKCQFNSQYNKYILEWKNGNRDGNVGINTRNISKHLKKYLIEKYGEYCSTCGWNIKHPNSKKVPLEIDHIDGNSENNLEKNLRLLCPNCHALTTNFKNFNQGKGRQWRIKKYIKNSK